MGRGAQRSRAEPCVHRALFTRVPVRTHLARLSAMAKRGNLRVQLRNLLSRRLMHLLGLVAVLPLVAVDPAMIVLLYDAELLALLGTVGLRLLRGDVRVMWLRVRDSQFVMEVRVAATLTRERPRSLLEC